MNNILLFVVVIIVVVESFDRLFNTVIIIASCDVANFNCKIQYITFEKKTCQYHIISWRKILNLKKIFYVILVDTCKCHISKNLCTIIY